MKNVCRFFAVSAVLIIFTFCCSTPKTHRILFIGDSITQGTARKGADGGFTYRYWLWKKLIDSGVEFDFVGSVDAAYGRSGDPGYPDYQGKSFDKDHEGHYGWDTSTIIKSLPEWLEGYTPDIVFIHLGHNDFWTKVSGPEIGYHKTDENLRGIISTLRNDNSKVKIFIARIIRLPDFSSMFPPAHINAVNEVIDTIVQEENTRKSPIYSVDLYTDFKPEEWTFDNTHPNAAGEQFIADRIFDSFLTTKVIK